MLSKLKRTGLLIAAVLFLILVGCKATPSQVPSATTAQTPVPSTDATASPAPQPSAQPLSSPDQARTVRVLISGIQLEDHIDQSTGREREGLANMVKRLFNEKGHQDINVEFISLPFNGIRQARREALENKTADVVLLNGLDTGALYAEGLLGSIDELLEVDKDFDPYSTYITGLFNSLRLTDYTGDVHVALPMSANQSYTMQDAVLFAQWGEELLPEAPTPQQILDKAKAMTGLNPVTGVQNYGLYFDPEDQNGATLIALLSYYHAQSGSGTMAEPSAMELAINTPEFKRALEWMNEAVMYMSPGIVDGMAGGNKMQTDNDTAIYLDSNGTAEMVRYLATLEGTWVSRNRPVMNMGRSGAGFANFDVLAMARGVKDEQAAWEVMKFLSGYEVQKWMYEQYGLAPTVFEQDFLLPVDDYALTSTKVLEASRPDARFDPQNPFFKEQILPYVSGYIKDRAAGTPRNINTDLAQLQQKAEDWRATFK